MKLNDEYKIKFSFCCVWGMGVGVNMYNNRTERSVLVSEGSPEKRTVQHIAHGVLGRGADFGNSRERGSRSCFHASKHCHSVTPDTVGNHKH